MGTRELHAPSPPSAAHALLAAPIVPVEKKDGTIRLCVDYRKLNQEAKFAMPRIEEVLDSVGSATIISTLDLAKGYWQIPLAEEGVQGEDGIHHTLRALRV